MPRSPAYTLTSGENGQFTIKGIDAGTYNLIESVAPDGYNKANFKIVITSTKNANQRQNWDGKETSRVIEELKAEVFDQNNISLGVSNTDKTVEPTANSKDTGKISIEVLNYTGATLPSTGGIGTTIFYTIGGIMVVAAVVLLITKKRMKTTK